MDYRRYEILYEPISYDSSQQQVELQNINLLWSDHIKDIVEYSTLYKTMAELFHPTSRTSQVESQIEQLNQLGYHKLEFEYRYRRNIMRLLENIIKEGNFEVSMRENPFAKTLEELLCEMREKQKCVQELPGEPTHERYKQYFEAKNLGGNDEELKKTIKEVLVDLAQGLMTKYIQISPSIRSKGSIQVKFDQKCSQVKSAFANRKYELSSVQDYFERARRRFGRVKDVFSNGVTMSAMQDK